MKKSNIDHEICIKTNKFSLGFILYKLFKIHIADIEVAGKINNDFINITY